jgi:CxxC motif-containing protein (DUF1111 family)
MIALVFLIVSGIDSVVLSSSADEEQGTPASSRANVALGEELFHREWVPGDERSPQGDGLGPVYNETSCVACHNLGGPGGGGPVDKNVVLLSGLAIGLTVRATDPAAGQSAAKRLQKATTSASESAALLDGMFAFVRAENARLAKEAGRQSPTAEPRVEATQAASGGTTTTTVAVTFSSNPQAASSLDPTDVERLAKLHPGFKTSSSVVLHRFGTSPEYMGWRDALARTRAGSVAIPSVATATDEMRQVLREMQLGARTIRGSMAVRASGNLLVIHSERNTTPLFGAGLIDAIPDWEVLAVAAEQGLQSAFPEIEGRACRLRDGRIGRFGWKAQTASLDDFVLNACAVELGLQVPEHPQAPDPRAPDAKSKGLDLTAAECATLTAYVASLPAPIERAPSGDSEKTRSARGRDLFASIGCATCHRPAVGEVTGIYSDLLLHNMGPGLGDSGSYGINAPDSSEEAQPGAVPTVVAASEPAGRRATVVGATRQEWRTPPLWGLRDSGPYLHDGRAATLEQAIVLHGGEAHKSAHRFFALSPQERSQVISFLKSLVAPTLALRNETNR